VSSAKAGQVPAPPEPSDAVPAEPQRQPGLLDRAAQELLAVTAWCPPPSPDKPDTLAVRFAGHLVKPRFDEDDGEQSPPTNDRFTLDETFERVGRAGPVAVTARLRDLTPGDWSVTAALVGETDATRRDGRPARRSADVGLPVSSWSLRRRPPANPDGCPLSTHLPPLAVAAGIIPVVWAATAVIGTVVGLIVQQVIVADLRPRPGGTLTVSVAGVAAGIVAAKVWFVALHLHRREPRFEGWAVQGFLAGFVIVAVSLLLASGTPVGAYLDTAAPGLFTGLAIGRVGCFFAGCCSGRPTTSRAGLWSSDQRVGTRRVPTQLLESALAAAVALGAGLTVGLGGVSSVWLFLAAVGAYTALRQAILGLRVEARQSRVGPRAVATVAAAVVAVSLAALVF
jgi:phosphatidylglycerol---prolipoprotein diacylglyceryl transferase